MTKSLVSFWKSARKTVVAVVGASITSSNIVVYSPPAAVTSTEWLSGAVLLATALGVYAATNTPKGV